MLIFNCFCLVAFSVLDAVHSVVIYRKSGGGWSSLLVGCFHSSTFLAMNGPLYFCLQEWLILQESAGPGSPFPSLTTAGSSGPSVIPWHNFGVTGQPSLAAHQVAAQSYPTPHPTNNHPNPSYQLNERLLSLARPSFIGKILPPTSAAAAESTNPQSPP